MSRRILERLRRDESGQALVLALAIIVVGMALGLGAITYALNVSGSASHDEHTRAAQQADDAGVQTQLFDQTSGNTIGYKLNPTTNGFSTLVNLLACEVPEVTGTQVVGKLALGVISGPCQIQVPPSCATSASACTTPAAPWSPLSNGSWSESEMFANPQLQGGSGEFPILFPEVVSLGCRTNDTTNGATTCSTPRSAAAAAGRNSYAREMAVLDPTAPLQAVEGENDVTIYSPGLLGQSAPTSVIDGSIVAGNTLTLPAVSAPVTTAAAFNGLNLGGSGARSPSNLLGGSAGQIAALSGLHPSLDYGYHCNTSAFMGATTVDSCGSSSAVSSGFISPPVPTGSGSNPCTAGSPSTNCWLSRPSFSLSAAGAPGCPSGISPTAACANGGFLDSTGNVTLTAPGTYVFCGVDIGGQLQTSGSGPIQVFVVGQGQDGCSGNGLVVKATAAVDTSGSPNLQATVNAQFDFNDASTGGTTPYRSVTWNFGDGTSPTVSTAGGFVSHRYSTAGIYFVTDTVIDASGLSGSFTFTVIVSPPLSPGTPACTSSPASGITCTSTASGGIPAASGYSYSWNFGDNGSKGDGSGSGTSGAVTTGAVSGTSSSGAVTTGFDYAIPGTYVVSLTVTDSTGASQTATTTIVDTPLNFTANPTTAASVNLGTASTFSGAMVSGGFGGYGYQWNFGDPGLGQVTSGAATGTLTSATVPSVSYRYAFPGTYVATLTVTSADGQTAVVYVQNVVVLGSNATGSGLTLSAGRVSASPAVGSAPLSTSFTYTPGSCQNSSSSSGTSTYNWNFGDNTSSTSQNPTHTYAVAGTYVTGLTVTCSLSGQSSPNQTYFITVVATSSALIPFSSNAASGTPPSASASGSTVTFTGRVSGGSGSGYIYSWNYGDGSTGTGATASHAYSSAGTYTAVMTVTDSAHNTAQYELTVIVTGSLTGSASPTVRVGVNVGFTATINATMSPAASYTWNFGDGQTQTIYSPSPQTTGGNIYGPVPHTYMSAGNYLATLTVTGATGLVSNLAYVLVKVDPDAQSATAGGNFIVSGGINQLASDNVSGLINGATITTSSVDPAAFQIYMQGNPSDTLTAGTSTTDPGTTGANSYAAIGGSGAFIDAFVIYAPRSSVNITAEPQGTTGGVFEGSAIGWNTSITALMVLQDFNLGNYPLSSVVTADSVAQTVQCDTSVVPLTNTSTDVNGCT